MYPSANSIKEARSIFRAMVKMLKASCLLLDITKEELVRMHDVVRDVTSWIASEEKKAFMVKTDTGLTNWPEEECLEQLTGISLIENNMRVLPSGLACPKLENLLLGCSESHGCCRSVWLSNYQYYDDCNFWKNINVTNKYKENRIKYFMWFGVKPTSTDKDWKIILLTNENL